MDANLLSNKIEGNFYSRYNNKLAELSENVDEMSEYIADCMPFIKMQLDENYEDGEQEETIFNCTIEKGLQKKEIFKEYLVKVEKLNSVEYNQPKETYKCKNCDGDINYFYNDKIEGNIICTKCGAVLESSVVTDELSYKEEQESTEKIINYSYKRENHFNEWISQFQAKETTNIPDEVIEQLRTEFKKQKIKKLSEITHTKVRQLLKKLKYNKYYEHIPYISNILNGIQPPSMTSALEERLRQMFKDIQKPFEESCPKERKNFLSYSYVLYKFCELLSEDEYLVCFPLLKSKEKLYQQDQIWKNICKILQWEFIPTV
jgi:hypothetical protein